jgi:phospholipase/carboxylesterase
MLYHISSPILDMKMHSILEAHEIETATNPRFSVIWLHGLGADGFDFAPIVPELVRKTWPAIRFIFPHAPVRAVTINGGYRMRAWYDILSPDFNQRADETGVRESIQQIDALIEREHQRGISSENIFLIGFSQGGAIALANGVRRSVALAGIAALSTYLPMLALTAAEMSPAAKATPIFFAHGSADPVVPMTYGKASCEALQQLGFTAQWHDYRMEHSVCAEEIEALGGWIDEILMSS